MNKKLMNWRATQIGQAGYLAADDLVDVINNWLDKHWKESVNPNDLAIIAREVVAELSFLKGLYRDYNNYCSTNNVENKNKYVPKV